MRVQVGGEEEREGARDHPPPSSLLPSGTFDLLVYADKDADVSLAEWEDSDARLIEAAANVRLRSFTTKVHRVDAMVSYRAEPDDMC